jgi:hypothetical protein
MLCTELPVYAHIHGGMAFPYVLIPTAICAKWFSWHPAVLNPELQGPISVLLGTDGMDVLGWEKTTSNRAVPVTTMKLREAAELIANIRQKRPDPDFSDGVVYTMCNGYIQNKLLKSIVIIQRCVRKWRETRHKAARRIQSAFLLAYYNPAYMICQNRTHRQFQALDTGCSLR